MKKQKIVLKNNSKHALNYFLKQISFENSNMKNNILNLFFLKVLYIYTKNIKIFFIFSIVIEKHYIKHQKSNFKIIFYHKFVKHILCHNIFSKYR